MVASLHHWRDVDLPRKKKIHYKKEKCELVASRLFWRVDIYLINMYILQTFENVYVGEIVASRLHHHGIAILHQLPDGKLLHVSASH